MKANEKLQDWQPSTFGDVLKERIEGGSQDDELLSVTNSRGVIRQSESNKRDTSNANKSKYKRVYVDDIVYNTMRMWQGVSGRSRYNGIVSPAYTVCTPVAGNDSRCLAALLKHPLNINLFRRYSQGLVDDTLSLKYDVFAQLPLILPSRQEQPRIARHLNILDTCIQHTEELIIKHKHARAGLMHDLLTYGINEYGEIRNPLLQPKQFKDSKSILGYVPNEWDVDLLRTALISIDAGKSPKCLNRPAAAGEWGVLKVSAIRPEGFKADENKAITSSLHINSAYEVKDGDLLISRANTYELVGSVCFVEAPQDS